MGFVDGSTTICEQRFTASGTWTVPVGVTSIGLLIVGGGGGGGSGGNNGGGGGGGGGQFSIFPSIDVDAGEQFTVTVGTGGQGGIEPALAGSNGTNSNIAPLGGGLLVSVLGGNGGATRGGDGGDSGGDGGGGSGRGDGEGGGGGGGDESNGTDAVGSAGGNGGAGSARSSSLFPEMPTFGGGGGGGEGAIGASGSGGGAGGTGGGGAGGNFDVAGSDGAANTGGGGGGGGALGDGGKGADGIVVIRVLAVPGGDPSPSATVPTPAMLTLRLNPGEGYACDASSVSALDGTWVDLPTAETCRSVEGLVPATLLGWATTPVFPIEIATRQVSNGWGAYETFDANGRLSGVFIPAGGATLISAEGELYAIWGS